MRGLRVAPAVPRMGSAKASGLRSGYGRQSAARGYPHLSPYAGSPASALNWRR